MASVAFSIAIPDDVVLDVEPLRFGAERRNRSRDDVRVAVLAGDRARRQRRRGLRVSRSRGRRARARPRDAILAVLASARPDWRGDDVIALAQLWEPELTR